MNIIKSLKVVIPTLVINAFCNHAYAGAASITFDQYRIVLDSNHQGDELTLRNADDKDAECLLSLTNFNFSPLNQLIEISDLSDVELPANNLLRYSPRTVRIPGRAMQKVKIGYRKKANLAPGEYISFFQISCSEKNENLVKGQPNIGARVNYNLPVHVRIGDLEAQSKIELLSVTKLDAGYTINLKQTREGSRSIIGDLVVIEKSTGDKLTELRNFSLYRPAIEAKHILSISEKPKSDVLIEFSERKGMDKKVVVSIEIPEEQF